jgi:hypothetical protein
MSVQIVEVNTYKQILEFVDFQFKLYKKNKFWVPPMKFDEINALIPEKNPAFKFCKAKFFLAYKNGKIAGRVGAIINEKYNEKTGEKYVRFSRIEFIDDIEVAKALLETVENFGRERGMEKIHGPLGFTNIDTQGMLIDGFDHIQSIASVYHHEYLYKHIESLQYQKENDWLEFRLTLGQQAVTKAMRGSQLVQKRYGFEVVKFTEKKEMAKYSETIFKILNNAFADLPYTAPFDEDLIKLYAAKYLTILVPRFTYMVKKDDKLVAFVIGMPSLSEAMQKAKGKLIPFGIFHIMKALKKPKVIDMFLTGVLPEYQNSGAAVILFAEIQNQMLKENIRFMETTGIFETNHNVISNWKNYDNIQHKRRRCFVKNLLNYETSM